MPPLNRDDSVLYFPPETFGPYRVLHQIGAGTLGPVFRAYEPDRDRLVAVKVFRLDITPERAAALAQALNSLVASGLTHPDIAAPLGAGVEGSVAYLAQEYVIGESLDVALREHGPMGLADALRVVDELADAIDALDLRGVNHGLLHPRDVLLAAEGARVSGFGIAKALTEVGVRLPVRRPYSAPERIRDAEWGRPADLFALAAMTHELLVGRRVAGTGAEAAGSVGEVAGVEGPALREIFATALAADPEARYRDARTFGRALRKAVDPQVMETAFDVDTAANEKAASDTSDRSFDERATAGLHIGKESVAQDERSRRGGLRERPDDGEAGMPREDPLDQPIHRDASAYTPEPFRPQGWEAEPPKALRAAAPVDDRSRVAMLPVAITLVVGLLVGFMAGYGLGSRERSPAAVTTAPPANPSSTVGSSVRESTVGVVSAAPVPTPGALTAAAPAAVNAPKANALNAVAPKPGVPARATPAPAPPASRPAAPVSAGRVLIRSSPAGARVTVNGEPRGVTPLTLRELPLGSYTIRLTRDGYVAEQRRLRLTAARQTASLVVPLHQARASARGAASGFGSLLVESKPSGAKVFLGNRLVGTTPLVISQLAAGSAAVRIEQEGYQSWTSAVRITAGERSRVTASLDRRSAR